jgi:hypothetical protein
MGFGSEAVDANIIKTLGIQAGISYGKARIKEDSPNTAACL